MDDNKKLPSGWGEDDDEDFGFDALDDDNGDTPWGNSTKTKSSKNTDEVSDTDKAESIGQALDNASENIESSDTPDETVKTQAVNNPAPASVYNNNTALKSKFVPILIAVIAVLVIALVAVGILFLTKNKSNNSGKSESNIDEQSSSISQTDEAVTTQTEETTETEIEEVTTEAPTAAETTVATEPPTEAATVPYEVYEDASNRALDKFMESYQGSSVNYNLTDVSGDGIPELFIKYNTEAASSSLMFYFNGTDYGEEISIGEGARICTSEHLVEAYGYGSSIVRLIFETDNDGNVILKDKLVIKMDMGTEYLINDVSVSESEYTELNSYYDSLNWEDVSRYEYKRTNTEPPKKEYTPEEIKSNAGSDFYFYDTPPYSYGRTVNIESGSLNLRAAPSTSADIIAKIPKGAYVGELGCNAEWSYISYTDENGASYVGYASSQYLY